MEFRDVFVEAGFTPSKRHPATFYFYNKKSEYRGKVVCHVDDSVWAGTGEVFRAAQQKVRERLPFKHEKSGKFTVLGRLVEKFEDQIEISQHEPVRVFEEYKEGLGEEGEKKAARKFLDRR